MPILTGGGAPLVVGGDEDLDGEVIHPSEHWTRYCCCFCLCCDLDKNRSLHLYCSIKRFAGWIASSMHSLLLHGEIEEASCTAMYICIKQHAIKMAAVRQWPSRVLSLFLSWGIYGSVEYF